MDTTATAGHDVVIVGARCAGATTAMLLAAAGHDVVLLDRDTLRSDTLSTHCIDRSGVVQLNRWGLLPAVVAAGTPPIREVVFHTGAGPEPRPIRDRAGVDMLVAPRRHVLDTLLVEAAVDAGAQFSAGFVVEGVRRDSGGRVCGVHGRTADGPTDIAARFVVGADGLRSRVARAVEAPITDVGFAGSGTHYAYFAGEWPAIEYFVGDRAFAGVFPTNGGEACVWVCMPSVEAVRFRRTHETLDLAFEAMIDRTSAELGERLRTAATRRSTTRGVVCLPNQVRHPVGRGWALVGDAGLHRDPITGHGMSDAFRDAELLASALDAVLRGDEDEAGALAGYHGERDAQMRDIFELTCALVTYPPHDDFTALLRQLSKAIDAQASTLAARRLPTVRVAA